MVELPYKYGIVVWINYGLLSMASILLFGWTKRELRQAIEGPDSEDQTLNLDQLWSCILYHKRGRVLPPIKFNLEYERLFVSALLHQDSSHLLANVGVHHLLLLSLRGYYSVTEIIFTTYYAILAGNIVSGVHQPNELSVGGSGYVFAVLGLKLAQSVVWLACLRQSLTRSEIVKNWFALFAGICLVALGFHSSNDTLNHSFGLITGLTVGLLKLAGFKRECSETKDEFCRYLWCIRGIKIALIAVPVLHLAYIIFFYGKDEDHVAAILNMGCD